MQTRVPSIEEGKDPGPLTRTRAFPIRLILILLVFLVLCAVFSFINLNTVRRFRFNSVVSVVSPSYEPYIIEPYGLDQWIKSPSNLMHTMSDEELFWRATLVPKISKYPFSRIPKIAFTFLAKGPLPLAPLWARFFKGHEGCYSIYIHSLPAYNEEFAPSSVFDKRHIPSQVAEWEKMSMCDAGRRLLANALLDISNEWFVLLSESCIPLYKFTFIHHYITTSKYSFMDAFDDAGP